jgi:4-hydroxybenzoate polyprenyltransferase
VSDIATSTNQATSVWLRFRWYLELVRFSHTIFALPFALLATAWAYVVPLQPLSERDASVSSWLRFEWRAVVGILLCMVTARSFAMAVNRLLDEKWDGENPRTAGRHLPAKKLSRSGVLAFTLVCALGFVASCLLFLPNRLPIALCVPVLAFLGGYSLAKRFTQLAHFWLGVALMLAPICVWIALRGEQVQSVPMDLLPAIMLGTVVLFWVAGFDIIYACQDAEYDRKAGLFSLPSKLGIRRALQVAAASHCVMWLVALAMTFVVPALSLGWLFRGMLGLVAILLVIEHRLVSERSLERIQVAFFQLNSIISVLFLVVGTLDAFWRES